MAEEYYTDNTIPSRIVKFFKTFLVHGKGVHAGKPFELLDWQKEIIYSLYGNYKMSNKLRRYRNALVLIPRKNGKTTLCAGLCIYELIFGEKSGEIYAVANSRDQARIIFSIASDMIASSNVLSKRIKIYKNALYNPKTRSTFRVLSRDANTALGLNASFVIFDELLAAPDDNLYNSMVTSMGARKEPLMLSISTAGFSKTSFLYQLVEHGQRINSKIINDDSFYAKIYGLKDDQDWTKETVWYECNPSLGHTITIDFFRTEYNRAKEFPRFENAFKTLYLNAWIDHQKSWISDSQWLECGEKIDINQFKGETCYAGLDLSSTTDLTALVLCFCKNEKYYLFSYPFCPSDGIRIRSRKDKVPYELWQQQGHLISTPGNATDYDYVLNKLQELSKDHNIAGICIDRWNSSYLSTKLMELGFNVIAFGQGFKDMASPVRAMERLVLNKGIIHDNHPVLRWCMSNVILKVDAAGNSKADKAKSRERIDLVVASLMALEETSKQNYNIGGSNIVWV
jgi:phage terminase large subunit-like protein